MIKFILFPYVITTDQILFGDIRVKTMGISHKIDMGHALFRSLGLQENTNGLISY